ncbi:MAG: hypothetical protein ACYTDY_09905, partial [Planctomycetota bacterium]
MPRERHVPLPSPQIPSVSFRTYRGPPDHAEMARILTVGRAEDGVEAAYTEERIDRWMGSMANADPREHVLLAEAEGAVVALGAADWRLES